MVFVKFMGMEDVPLLGAGFNTWFPLVMVVYVGILTTGVFEQCFTKLFVPPNLRFDSEKADDEHSSKGQALLSAEEENLANGGILGAGCGISGMDTTGQDDMANEEATGAGSSSRNIWGKRAKHSIELGLSERTSKKYSSIQRLRTGQYSSLDKNEEDDGLDSSGNSPKDHADLLFSNLGR